MVRKNKVIAAFLLSLFLSSGFFVPVITFINQNSPDYDLGSQKLMFDKSILPFQSSRVIVNLEPGSDLNQGRESISRICGDDSTSSVFEFISAICCEASEEEIYEIAKLESVTRIYLDEAVKIDVEPAAGISYDEIFQLNQCAEVINSRVVPFTGQGINISIIDTGIDAYHADLSGKLVAQKSFVLTTYGWDPDEVEGTADYNGHGTHCAGIATGTGVSAPSGYGITGIAPGANLVNAKALDRYGGGYVSSVIAAIEWSIAQNAGVISMSLGFSSSDPDHPVCRAVDNATAQGIVVCVSAGNSGPFYSAIGAPGAARSVITVGATNKHDRLAEFSSRGSTLLGYTDPDVIAPGEDVLSTIGGGSLIEAMMDREGYHVEGTGGNDYAILSGTSMSCPMVAGAAALLLEAFPTLTPNQVRIALMEGAESLGYTPNEEGAGQIDVNASYNILQQASPSFNISTVLPKTLPIPPLAYSLFPGDSYSDDLILLLGEPTNLSVNCVGNVSPYITIQDASSEMPLMNVEFANLEVNFQIPLSIAPGIYTGTIEIRENITSELLETVDLVFEVKSPRGRVYFDCLHNTDIEDHMRKNYHNFTKLLYEHSIAMTFGSSLLSFPLLSQYDILLLPDIELPFTPRELQEVEKYWANGGNILILGSSYPETSVESLNALLSMLDAGINYSKTNIKQSYDMGLVEFLDDFLITNLTNHPVTSGVAQFTWLNGVALEVDPLKASTLAYYGDMPVVAAVNETAHKLMCLGAERAFYDDFLSEEYNEKFALQVITWLLNDSQRSNAELLRTQVVVEDPILELGGTNSTDMAFYVFDPITQTFVDNLVPHINLSCTVEIYAGGWIPIWSANTSDIVGLGTGAYATFFNITTTGLYRVNITIANLSSSRDGIGLCYLNGTQSMPRIEASTLSTSANGDPSEYDITLSHDIYRNEDQVTFNLTIYDADTTADITNVTCYITSLDMYRSDIKYIKVEMGNITSKTGLRANFSLTISPDYGYPAGTYAAFIEVVDSDGNRDYTSSTFEFYINDKYPTIDTDNTKFKGSSVQSLISSLSMPNLKHGKSFSVEIMGNDTESALETMHAYVILFDIIIVGFMGYTYQPLWAAELPFVTDRFVATLSLPSSGISDVLDESYSLGGTLALIFLLVDSDGQYDDDSYTGLTVKVQAPFPMSIIWIVVGVLAGLAAFLFIWFRRKPARP